MEGLYDVIVIGGGPAGLTAALYLARARLRVLVLERGQYGGQIAITEEVVNYPGIERTDGHTLGETMRRQAEGFGAEFLPEEALSLSLEEKVKTVTTGSGTYRALCVLLATGAQPRSAGFQGEAEHKGRGVAYCATCDGEFFTGKEIFVVGGGYAAAEESVFLTKFARHVTILIRREDFSCAASVAQAARDHEKITVLPTTVVEEVSGSRGLDYIRYKNTVTGQVTEYRADDGDFFGLFVFAGYAPDTGLVRGLAALDPQGYVITDAGQKTSVDGLYAAGDVCAASLRQAVTAAASGAVAATAMEKYVSPLRESAGLSAPPPRAAQSPSAPRASENADDSAPFPPEMAGQLEAVFSKMDSPLLLKLSLDDRPVSRELEAYMTALAALTEKLTVQTDNSPAGAETAPCVRVCREDGSETGLAFHGVPGGHEFSSFVLGLYNTAGPGQTLDDESRRRIAAIPPGTDLKILVTLSCTMCPDLVAAAQRIAAEHPTLRAEVYDIRHFDALREHYQVMSVPCLILNDARVFFGKKSLSDLLDLLGV